MDTSQKRSKMDTRSQLKKDVSGFIKEVVGVDDQDFRDKVLDVIWNCPFDGYDITGEENKNIKDLNEEYIKQIPKEEHKSFIPRLKILHPRYYPTLRIFVRRFEAIVKNELKH